jgi:hypothetical protein
MRAGRTRQGAAMRSVELGPAAKRQAPPLPSPPRRAGRVGAVLKPQSRTPETKAARCMPARPKPMQPTRPTAQRGPRAAPEAPGPGRTPTALSLMCVARWRPPMTAAAVHSAWPAIEPTVTPTTSCDAASPMVAIWLRSPHSARKVRVNALRKTWGREVGAGRGGGGARAVGARGGREWGAAGEGWRRSEPPTGRSVRGASTQRQPRAARGAPHARAPGGAPATLRTPARARRRAPRASCRRRRRRWPAPSPPPPAQTRPPGARGLWVRVIVCVCVCVFVCVSLCVSVCV